MSYDKSERDRQVAILIVAGGVVIAGLVYGSGFLIPVVVAFLLANLIEAMVERLESMRVPTAIAFIISILVVLAAFYFMFRIVSSQVDAISRAWPEYVARIESIIQQVAQWVGEDVRNRLQVAIQQIDITAAVPSLIGSAGGLVLSAGLVAIYVGFLLAERGAVTRKLSSLASDGAGVEQVEHMLKAVSTGVRKYIWIKTVMSVLTGGVSYVVFLLVGIDFAETWALLVFFLNYIPSVGSALGVIFPALLALVQFDTLVPFFILAVCLATAQFVIGNVIEPIFMGRFLNLSPFVIIVSLTFWTTVWGIAGAFLSVPITIAMLIVCANVESWRWMAVLLSQDGNLEPITTAESGDHGGSDAAAPSP